MNSYSKKEKSENLINVLHNSFLNTKNQIKINQVKEKELLSNKQEMERERSNIISQINNSIKEIQKEINKSEETNTISIGETDTSKIKESKITFWYQGQNGINISFYNYTPRLHIRYDIGYSVHIDYGKGEIEVENEGFKNGKDLIIYVVEKIGSIWAIAKSEKFSN